MTRYETIVSLGDEFLKLVNSGLIPVTLLDWKVYYENYKHQFELQKKNFKKPLKHEAMHIAADNFDISKRHMQRVVTFMEGA